ncbi:HIT domain-containing protein [Pyrobaculum aerophilum]|uniref:HIT domain-containing protein n=1 Tax=Pyrobaculum aerophilum TaxID=13773 RepID=UPI0023F41491|nr:HIT domain-containing protein [Pyrobaculum aerophilum]MCX8137973.1 HIT domain-containing protein [Pyrobaculum aerophilum]
MRVVYAPWRYRYIKSVGKGGCFLCSAAGEAGRDDENLVPYRGRHVFAILNKYPYTWGHVMVAPYRHISQFEEMTAEEWAEMIALAKKLAEAVSKLTGSRDFVIGLNIGRAAGAGLESHIHLHVIPKDTEVKADDLEKELIKLTRELRALL